MKTSCILLSISIPMICVWWSVPFLMLTYYVLFACIHLIADRWCCFDLNFSTDYLRFYLCFTRYLAKASLTASRSAANAIYVVPLLQVYHAYNCIVPCHTLSYCAVPCHPYHATPRLILCRNSLLITHHCCCFCGHHYLATSVSSHRLWLHMHSCVLCKYITYWSASK